MCVNEDLKYVKRLEDFKTAPYTYNTVHFPCSILTRGRLVVAEGENGHPPIEVSVVQSPVAAVSILGQYTVLNPKLLQ